MKKYLTQVNEPDSFHNYDIGSFVFFAFTVAAGYSALVSNNIGPSNTASDK